MNKRVMWNFMIKQAITRACDLILALYGYEQVVVDLSYSYKCNQWLKESLCEGIRRIDSDVDYWEFVEIVYSLKSELYVYIDHRNKPIIDWADNELLADDKGYESDELDEEVDNDSELSETMEYEHECDEEVHAFDKTVGDPFVDKLSGHISDDDEEEENNGKYKDVVFPVHNENQE
ncbi:unnamed protein product [Lactuca saligna]|uniref:Uncharacterized protein n=1 Tax=Lactuca saligna TaxID=75948 RepID=A0AA35YDC6_LACSI|nr:unnamed protein product [Lactuca saligna]